MSQVATPTLTSMDGLSTPKTPSHLTVSINSDGLSKVCADVKETIESGEEMSRVLKDSIEEMSRVLKDSIEEGKDADRNLINTTVHAKDVNRLLKTQEEESKKEFEKREAASREEFEKREAASREEFEKREAASQKMIDNMHGVRDGIVIAFKTLVNTDSFRQPPVQHPVKQHSVFGWPFSNPFKQETVPQPSVFGWSKLWSTGWSFSNPFTAIWAILNFFRLVPSRSTVLTMITLVLLFAVFVVMTMCENLIRILRIGIVLISLLGLWWYSSNIYEVCNTYCFRPIYNFVMAIGKAIMAVGAFLKAVLNAILAIPGSVMAFFQKCAHPIYTGATRIFPWMVVLVVVYLLYALYAYMYYKDYTEQSKIWVSGMDYAYYGRHNMSCWHGCENFVQCVDMTPVYTEKMQYGWSHDMNNMSCSHCDDHEQCFGNEPIFAEFVREQWYQNMQNMSCTYCTNFVRSCEDCSGSTMATMVLKMIKDHPTAAAIATAAACTFFV